MNTEDRAAALRRTVHSYLAERYVATISTVARPHDQSDAAKADWEALEVIWGPISAPVRPSPRGDEGGEAAGAADAADTPDAADTAGAADPGPEPCEPLPEGFPHAATVFYALDGEFDLLFLSREDSRHARDIAQSGRVAATVTDSAQEWRDVRGLQLWGRARVLRGNQRLSALTRYVTRLPLLKEVARDPRTAAALKNVGVFQVNPERIAWTDNRSGLFGREIIDLRENPRGS